jgi:heat shock protein HslJ
MRRTRVFVLLATIACASTALTALPSSAAPARPSLRATNWVLTDQVSIGTPLDGVVVNAVFGTKRVEGSSGCNGYSNSYTTSGGRMAIKDDGVSTQMACGGAADDVESAYRAALRRVGRWRISGTTLTLSTRTGRRLLAYRASGGTKALEGSWHVTGFYTGNAISSPAPGTTLTIEFSATEASGNSGCNTYSGPFELSGVDAIALGPFSSTLRACADPAVDTQEQQYLAALGLARTYQVSGKVLTLVRDGGTIAASAQRSS